MGESGKTKLSLTWDKDTTYALGVYRLVGHTFGIWPNTCHNLSAKIKFFLAFALQLILMYNLVQDFLNGCISVFNVDYIGVLVTATVSLLKIVVIRLHQKGMNLIVDSAVNDWCVFRDDNSREIMRKYAYFGRFVSIFQIGGGFASALSVVLALPPTIGQTTTNETTDNNSTIATPRNVLIGSDCSLIDASSYFYFFFYFFQLIQLTLLCTCSTGCDAIFFGLAMHLCAQLELLNIDISQFGYDAQRKSIKEDFVNFVDRHNHLAGLVNLIEDIFHIMILGQLAASTLHISLLGIKILYGMQDGDSVTIIYSSIAVTSLLRQIFVSSFAGDYLVTHTNAIRDAAYNCCWYNLSPSLARGVMFVIVRSNSSFHLTAGKIIRMNIESFTSLLKAMMSFFSVLKLTIID